MRVVLKYLILICLFTPNVGIGQIQLPKFYGSNMVLPRNIEIPIKGKAGAFEKLEIKIDNQTHSVQCDTNGKWEVMLNPLKVGSPVSLKIYGKDSLILDNILIGDLWLCSGQSNMQYTLEMLGYKLGDIAPADYPNLRLLTVGVDTDYLPKEDIKNGDWNKATAKSIQNFSAVAFFFGKDLIENQNVPIGLISSNLGATTIETWMSVEALKKFPQFAEVTNEITKINKSFQTINEELADFRKTWDPNFYLKGPGIEKSWWKDDYDDTDWKECTTPMFWEYLGEEDHDGSFWFRKKFDLDSSKLNEDLVLNLNQIDDYDITWVNGINVGETFGNRNFRSYIVPKEILRSKDNTLTVRVFDIGGLGGIYTSAFWGNSILNGKWKYKKGLKIDSATFPKPIIANGSIFSHPSLLYNGSVAPLHSLPIKGVIWYQGESNEARAEEYGSLLKTLISDWRSKWNNSELPFLIVQLANYKAENEKPMDELWPELRASQFEASTLENVDIVTAIDIGEAGDIHPFNKKEVGRRLALLAMHYSYGGPLLKGPVYLNHRINGDKVIVKMDTYGSYLKSLDKHGYLRGFEISNESGVFHWAKAYIDGKDEVVVYSPEIKKPKFVRYAWSNNPGPLDLINDYKLPAFPFRTDTLPLLSQGKKFEFDPFGF